MKNYTLEMPYGKIVFRRQCGGFPAEIEVRDFDGALFHLIHNMHSFLSLKTEDDTIFHPFCDSAPPFFEWDKNGCKMLEFSRISWQNSDGQKLDNLFLSLKWEFYPDGVCVFVICFFYFSILAVLCLKDLKLSVPLNFYDVR